MLHIKSFVFNAFQVNCYLLYNDAGDCVIVDPSCYQKFEQDELTNFITANNLTPKALWITHCHVDHILGTNFIHKTYGLKPMCHPDGLSFFKGAKEHAWGFGFDIENLVEPVDFIEHAQLLKIGDEEIQALYTPGHADGSICFYNKAQGFVIVGDVLFLGSIGRTDLPTGDFDTLKNSIQQHLYTLPEETLVYSGHGPHTTIAFEKESNPHVNENTK